MFNIRYDSILQILFDYIRYYSYLRKYILFLIRFTNTNNEPNFVIRFGYEYRANRQIKMNMYTKIVLNIGPSLPYTK